MKVLEGEKIPLRLPMGTDAWGMIRADTEKTLNELEEWKVVSESVSSPEQLESINFLKQ